MSLILEALRKSEAERQRGRAPGLFVEQVPTRPTARARMPAWAWALALLLTATLALLAWREWQPQQERGQVHFDADAAAASAVQPGDAPMMPPRAEVPAAPTAPPVAAPLPAPAATAVPAAAAKAAPADEALAAPPPRTAALAGSELMRTPDVSPSALSAVSSAPPAALSTPAELVEVNLTPFPGLGSLDAGTRAQLPPLRVTMHVFADAPAQRFVILDGQRLGEGASPAAGIVVEEIRREGLVLSVNGQRVLLARP